MRDRDINRLYEEIARHVNHVLPKVRIAIHDPNGNRGAAIVPMSVCELRSLVHEIDRLRHQIDFPHETPRYRK